METIRIENEFSKYKLSDGFVPISNLYVEYIDDSGNTHKVALDKLFYGTSKESSNGSRKTKSITSYEQLRAQSGKNNVYLDKEGKVELRVDLDKIEKKNIEIPTSIDSYSINTDTKQVGFGLKRNVTMEADNIDGTHALVKIDGDVTYVEKKSIYFIAPDGKKELGDMSISNNMLNDKTLYDGATGKAISEVYSATLFKPTSINREEVVEFAKGTKTTYETKVADDGSISFTKSSSPLDTSYSEHRYVQKKVEGKAGKSETVSMIEARNFVFDQGEDFILVNGSKIFLDQIEYLESYVSNRDRKILASDLAEGKKIVYDHGRKSKVLDEGMMRTLTTEEDGRTKITFDGRDLYLEDIDQILLRVNNPTKDDFHVEGTIKYKDGEGNDQLIDISAGQAIVDSTAGDHAFITINGRGQMVPISYLRDANGKEISNLSEMVGKQLMILEEQTVGDETKLVPIALTDKLTYEQANMQYSTRKSFQPSEKTKADNTTYRKLVTGEMVKESMINVPKAYKKSTVTDRSQANALLVPVEEGGEKRYVIVSKDYFSKYGDTSSIKDSTEVIPLVRCEMGDNDCIAIQTTSRGKEVEECTYLGGLEDDEKKRVKQDASQAVQTGIEDGKYIIDDAKNAKDEYEKLEESGKRYEYTDKILFPDYAANGKDYEHLSASGISVKDGKVVGGVKYKMGKGFTKDFSTYGKIIGYGFGFVALSSIFLPVVGTFAGIAFAATLFGGPAFIVGKHIIKAAQKNNLQMRLGIPFKDKEKLNQKALEKELKLDISALYEKMKTGALTKENFEHEIATLKQKAYALSRSNSNTSIKAVNGVAQVTQENVNTAIKYKKEYAATLAKRDELKEELEKAQKELNKGKITNKEYGLILGRYNHYNAKFEALKNGEFTEQNLDDMSKNTAAFMIASKNLSKAHKKVKKFKKNETKHAEQLAAQEKLIEENERRLNSETATSQNLNSNRSRNNELAESANMGGVLESIDDMRALVYLQNFKTSKEVKDLIAGLGGDASIIESLGYDEKQGITYDGKALKKARINEETREMVRDLITSAKPAIQQNEQATNQHYEDMSVSELRAEKQRVREQEVVDARANEQASAEQAAERMRQAENEKEITRIGLQAMKELKDTHLPALEQKEIEIKNALSTAKSKLEDANQNLPQLEMEWADKRSELNELKLPLSVEETRYTELGNKHTELQTKLQSATVKQQEAQRQIVLASTDEQYQLALRNKKQVDSEILDMEADMSRLKPLVKQSKQKLDDLKKKQNVLIAEINQIKSEIVKTKQAISTLPQTIAEKEEELAETTKRLQEMQDRVAANDEYMASHSEFSA